VVFAHHGPLGVRQILVEEDAPAHARPFAYRVRLGPATASWRDVLAAVEESESRQGWRLVMQHAGCSWPGATTVWSTPDDCSWPFELTLPGSHRDAIVYLQGPFAPGDAPRAEALVAPGMIRVKDGALPSERHIAFIELSYAHEGQPWLQRRCWVPCVSGTFLVTCQAPAGDAAAVIAAADEVGVTLS
jgi:hypothetical protein